MLIPKILENEIDSSNVERFHEKMTAINACEGQNNCSILWNFVLQFSRYNSHTHTDNKTAYVFQKRFKSSPGKLIGWKYMENFNENNNYAENLIEETNNLLNRNWQSFRKLLND